MFNKSFIAYGQDRYLSFNINILKEIIGEIDKREYYKLNAEKC